MGEQGYYSDQSTCDEVDVYVDELWSENEEDYDRDSEREELEPKPPDPAQNNLNHQTLYEEGVSDCGELDFEPPDNTRSSTWSRPHNTSYTSESVVHFNPYRQSVPKIQLYVFSGRNSYLEWERNMDDWFYYNHIKEEKRLAHAIDQLSGEAYKWWVQEKAERRRYQEPTITTWKMLKGLLTKEYAPKRRTAADRDREVAGRNRVDKVRVKDKYVPRSRTKGHTTPESSRNKVISATESKREKTMSKMSKTSKTVQHGKETNKNYDVWMKAIKVQMEQMFSEHLDAYRKELQQNSYQKHVPNMELIDTSNAEQAKVSDQLNKADHISSLNMITLLVCPKEAEKGTGEKVERPATPHSLTCPDKEDEPFAPNSLALSISAPNNMILTAKSTSHVLLDTKISKTHDLIQYWQHYMTGHSIKYSCFNVSISSIMHLFFSMSFQKQIGAEGALFDMRIKEKPPDWQSLPSVLKELKQGASMQTRLIRGCIRINAELNHIQERTLLCCIQFKENPPDICLQNPKQWTYGNYLESQKRMKPCLLSIGTGQTILTTQWREYEAIDKPTPYQSPGRENSKSDLKQGWAPLILIRARDKECEYLKGSFCDSKDPSIFYHTDMICLFLPKEPNAGIKTTWNRPRRIHKWEEDQRFKPPDLNQNKRHHFVFFQIKEEPPDATMRLHIFGGNFLILVHFMITNLLYVYAGNPDLRSNPSQVGGDDMRMDEQLGSLDQSKHKRRWS